MQQWASCRCCTASATEKLAQGHLKKQCSHRVTVSALQHLPQSS